MAEIIVEGTILVDGYPLVPEIDALVLSGNIAGSFDVNLAAGETDKAVNLSGYGTISRIYLIAKSGTIIYELDGVAEEYDLDSFAILSYQPTALTLTNSDADSTGLVEVIIIGE